MLMILIFLVLAVSDITNLTHLRGSENVTAAQHMLIISIPGNF